MDNDKYHTFLPVKQFAVIGAPQSLSSALDNKVAAKFPKIIREVGLMDVIKASDALAVDYGDAFEPDDAQFDSTNEPEDTADEVKEDGSTYLYVKNWASLSKTTEKLFHMVKQAIDDKRIPIIIGGDHGIATGSIGASLTRYENLIVLFIDAHTDINTPFTSVHGNYHGMPLANLSGLFKARGFDWVDKVPKLDPKSIIYIGLRSVYQVDKDLMDKLEIPYYTMHDVNRMGIGKVLEEAFKKVDPEGKRPIHLSFDMDSCDPSVAPGTGTKLEGGLSYSEALYIPHFANNTKRVVSMDFCEVNVNNDIVDTSSFQPRLPIKPGSTHTTRLCLRLISEAVMGKGIQTSKRFRY